MGAAAARVATGRGRAIPLLLPLLVAFLLTSTTHAVLLTLPSGRAKCVTKQHLGGPAASLARYRVTNVGGNGAAARDVKICVRVTDPEGKSIHQAESVESGEFAFVVKRTGRYSACFWSPTPRFENVASISIDVEWRTGNATQHWTAVARESKIEVRGQMREVRPVKRPLQGSNSSATIGAKASTTAGDKAPKASGEDEEDDEDDKEDEGGGKEN